jgi:hypothetical protein
MKRSDIHPGIHYACGRWNGPAPDAERLSRYEVLDVDLDDRVAVLALPLTDDGEPTGAPPTRLDIRNVRSSWEAYLHHVAARAAEEGSADDVIARSRMEAVNRRMDVVAWLDARGIPTHRIAPFATGVADTVTLHEDDLQRLL